MSEHFIKNIEVKNFKCFKDFKAEGFGRVNLIGGKNNVGKTAFMEVCFLSDAINGGDAEFDCALFTVENNRGVIEKINQTTIGKIIIKYTPFEFGAKLGDKLNNKAIAEFSDEGHKITLTRNKSRKPIVAHKEVMNPELYIKTLYNFIPSYMIGDDLIVSVFDKIKEQRKRDILNQILNQFDSNILEFDIINNKPQVFLDNIEQFQDVIELGHGLKRYIAFISSILINKDGYLFIDEVENGIHYLKLDDLWEIILTISKQQNVQVFATTHSKECIESYARVAKRLKETDIKFLSLYKDRKNELKSITFDCEKIQDRIELGLENR